jgi:glutaconate CoA-transferase, subunit B
MAVKEYAKDYYPAELMVVIISRIIQIQTFKRIGGGTFAQIPLLAARLVQATSIPDILVFSGPAGCAGSKFEKLSWYTGDESVHAGAEFRFPLSYVMDSFGDPKLRWGKSGGFMGGFQVDKYGNVNMTVIGDQKHPKYRGPGTIGLMALGFRSSNIFVRYHNPRLFVEKVDFISGPGYGTGPGWREEKGCPPGSGPQFCITPLALFDFDEATKIMRLKSVHHGHTVDEVISRTGFKPIIPDHVPETEPPTVQELEFMRDLDPDGILPKLTE